MHREHVEHGARSAARAVGSPEVLDEAGRRVRLALAVRVVAAAGREGTADHVHVRIDALDRVVGLGQERQVGGRRRVGAVGPELRHPEEVEVRLVADDHVVHVR